MNYVTKKYWKRILQNPKRVLLCWAKEKFTKPSFKIMLTHWKSPTSTALEVTLDSRWSCRGGFAEGKIANMKNCLRHFRGLSATLEMGGGIPKENYRRQEWGGWEPRGWGQSWLWGGCVAGSNVKAEPQSLECAWEAQWMILVHNIMYAYVNHHM